MKLYVVTGTSYASGPLCFTIQRLDGFSGCRLPGGRPLLVCFATAAAEIPKDERLLVFFVGDDRSSRSTFSFASQRWTNG